MMKNAFYFTLKALFVLKIFDYVGKRLDKKAIVYFKVYDIIGRAANNYNGYIAKNKAERLAPDLFFFKRKKKKRFKI